MNSSDSSAILPLPRSDVLESETSLGAETARLPEKFATLRPQPARSGATLHPCYVSHSDTRARARRTLPLFVFDYLEGGADREECIDRNAASLRRLLLMPDRLTDVQHTHSSTVFFGRPAALPIVIAPTGFNALFWPHGDIALARAAAAFQIPFALSTAANSTIEDVCHTPHLDCWFQLYVFQDRAFAESLMHRAQRAGCRTLVLTVDMPVSGHRLRDVRKRFSRDFSYRRAALDAIKRPRWAIRTLAAGRPELANIFLPDAKGSNVGSNIESAKRLLANGTLDRGLTWHHMEWIRRNWAGTIVLKGLMNAEDAQRASDIGIEGIVVSNHGGRQLDSAPAAMDVLHDIAQRVRKNLTVLVDGGFTHGSDIVKALALGAHGVLVGRSTLYGLACHGEYGVRCVLQRFKDEFERTLALMGVARQEDLRPRHVVMERTIHNLGSSGAGEPSALSRSRAGYHSRTFNHDREYS